MYPGYADVIRYTNKQNFDLIFNAMNAVEAHVFEVLAQHCTDAQHYERFAVNASSITFYCVNELALAPVTLPLGLFV